MKRLILKFAWWLDHVCHRLIDWADPIADERVRQAFEEWKRGATMGGAA